MKKTIFVIAMLCTVIQIQAFSVLDFIGKFMAFIKKKHRPEQTKTVLVENSEVSVEDFQTSNPIITTREISRPEFR